MEKYIRWFNAIDLTQVNLVGGKTASLGEMYQSLTPLGIPVPNGFGITSDGYRAVLDHANAWEPLQALLATLDQNGSNLQEIGAQARQIVYSAGLPEELQKEVLAAYGQLKEQYGDPLRLAVRSSATAEDLPTASFAGQHESYLNIRGDEALLESCRHCFASLFTDRAITYRLHNGFDHFKVYLAIAVMKMVSADRAASGVMFSLDTDTGFRDVVFINGAYGLGENIVQGQIDPDEFYVHKPTYEKGYRAVLRRQLGAKQLTMVCGDSSDKPVLNTETPDELRARYCLTDQEVLKLAGYAIDIEQHYSQLKGGPCPMDMEWAKDADDGELYLVQARPETIASQKPRNTLTRYRLTGKGNKLAEGRAIGTSVVTASIARIDDESQLDDFRDGDILLADSTSPDWGPHMRRASGLITARGGRTCHAAIVAREFGIPALVGVGEQAENLQDGQLVTLSCAEGETGTVFEGEVAFEKLVTELDTLPSTKTQMMINLGSPDQAFRLSALPSQGVGLARMEFIITEYIKAHPMALLHPEKITHEAEKTELQTLIRQYPNGADFFIEKLSEGIATIAAAFYPYPVIVRTSDFKTNEYAGLLGGSYFEPSEENPMIGFRGASRYAHPAYAEGFALECAALCRARDDMGFDNIKVMIPFCRRVEEGRKVLAAMADHGLVQGKNGLLVYVMCEIPNNVIQIDAFSELFDGVSIGSNDLTQLTLGVDRDSDIVAFDFDERDPGVLAMLRMAIEGAHRNQIPVGICGQAPSDYPEVAEYLVKLGINSISLNPDVLIRTIQLVAELEKNLDKAGG